MAFPPYDRSGEVERIGGIAEDITEVKLAAEHQGILLAELQHRVRNIISVIRSIATRTGQRAESVPDYAALMESRLLALARVQTLLTRTANVSVPITSIVREEVGAQAQNDGQYDIEGPEIELSLKSAEVLTLVFHELATNALKYGALSQEGGKVTVRWSTFDRRGTNWLSFDWVEQRAPGHPQLPPGADPAWLRRRVDRRTRSL